MFSVKNLRISLSFLRKIQVDSKALPASLGIIIDRSRHVETLVLLSQQKPNDARQPQCPEEKEKPIVEALKHFGMIN
jgi:hypothetical protein